MMLVVDRIPTPLGSFVILVEHGQICAAGFVDGHERMAQDLRTRLGQAEAVDDPDGLSTAIRRYFAGETTAIDDLPVRAPGTAFQRDVWNALRTIPAGATWSYGQLARHIGRPKAVRAVGAANGNLSLIHI